MYSTENSIRDFLKLKGVQLFWIDSTINQLRPALAANSWLVTHMVEQKVSVSVTGRVKRYTAIVGVSYPDLGTRSTKSITYTFDPKRNIAHKVKLNPIHG